MRTRRFGMRMRGFSGCSPCPTATATVRDNVLLPAPSLATTITRSIGANSPGITHSRWNVRARATNSPNSWTSTGSVTPGDWSSSRPSAAHRSARLSIATSLSGCWAACTSRCAVSSRSRRWAVSITSRA